MHPDGRGERSGSHFLSVARGLEPVIDIICSQTEAEGKAICLTGKR
ncbi:MAG: hypothetical protein EBE86_029330 [Hormoscilla sp. GUM202]|nr:hypothetical protein [Hormoscilla sp. GUM202]